LFLSFAAGISLDNLVCRVPEGDVFKPAVLGIRRPKLPGKGRRRCSGRLDARWYCCPRPIRADRGRVLSIGDR
jgi:hypothetical protein